MKSLTDLRLSNSILQEVAPKKAPPFMAGELIALIGRRKDVTLALSAPDSHVQASSANLSVNAAASRPVNDLPRAQVNHHGQVQPAFMR